MGGPVVEYLLGVICIELFLILLGVAHIHAAIKERSADRRVEAVMTPFVVEEPHLNKNTTVVNPDPTDTSGTYEGPRSWT